MRQRNRLALHEKLCDILGSRNVYHDPPSNIHLNYPCIIYKRSTAENRMADNKRYIIWYPYDVQIISKDPDFELFDTFLNFFDYGRENAPFISDNLHHSNFTIYT